MYARLLASLVLSLALGCASSDVENNQLENNRSNPDAGVDPNNQNRDGGQQQDDMSGFSNEQNNPVDDMSFDPLPDMGDMSDPGSDAGADMMVVDMPPDMPTAPCANDPSSQGWEAMGAPLDALGMMTNARLAAVAVDDSCRALVAFHQADGTNPANIFVFRWESGSWSALGGAVDSNDPDDTFTSSVAIATMGDTPYIAWVENTGSENVHVARWDGAAWQKVGNVSTPESAFGLSFVVDSTGRPIVAWSADNGLNTRNQIYVARYEAMSWGELASPLVNDFGSNAAALAPVLAMGPQDQPYVVWQEDSKVHARRWEVNNWIDFVGAPIDSGNGNFSAFGAVVDIAPNGDMVMGWREATNQNSTDVFVQRWNGSNFTVIADGVDVEPETNGRTNTLNLALAVDGQDRTIFAFDEPEESFGGTTNVHVFRHDVSGLAPLGMGTFDINPGETSARHPALAIDPQDRTILAFSEDNGTSSEIHVWRYTD